MPSPNWQRLSDLGQLPKNFITNRLWQKNIDVNRKKIQELEEENKRLRGELEKYQAPEPVTVRNPLKSNSKSDEGFEIVK